MTIGLLPVLIASLIFDLQNTLRILSISIASGFVCDYLFAKLNHQNLMWRDGSTFYQCALFAFLLPAQISVQAILVGVFFVIVIAKECFGGFGKNIFQPALVGRAALFVLFREESFSFLKNFDANGSGGAGSGMIGEVSILAIVIGGAYLVYRSFVLWKTPVIFLLTLFGVSMLNGIQSVAGLFTGSVFFAAFFLVGDSVVSPVASNGRVLSALFAAACVSFLKQKLTYPEAVTYGILLTNTLVPLMDRYLKPKREFR